MRRPTLLILAVHIMGAASGRPGPIWGMHYVLRQYSKRWPPRILKALATHSFKSIGHPSIIKPHVMETALYWNNIRCMQTLCDDFASRGVLFGFRKLHSWNLSIYSLSFVIFGQIQIKRYAMVQNGQLRCLFALCSYRPVGQGYENKNK
jgi:hypothetical protein